MTDSASDFGINIPSVIHIRNIDRTIWGCEIYNLLGKTFQITVYLRQHAGKSFIVHLLGHTLQQAFSFG